MTSSPLRKPMPLHHAGAFAITCLPAAELSERAYGSPAVPSPF
jgi:hypothetical protein